MKLPNGYGSVIKLSKHRRKPYAARVTVGWTDDGRQIKKYIGTFQTRQEALNALAAKEASSPHGLRRDAVNDLEQLQRHGATTGCNVTLPALHDLPFSALRKRHIQAAIDACALSVQAKSHMKSVCSQMYRYAIDMEIAATNYASLVELPVKAQSDKHKPFTRAELVHLWQHQDDIAAKVALILCYTGLRPTELAQIKTADVDLSAHCMRGGIKTAAGKNRVVPIADKILPLIEGFYNPANEYLLTQGTEPLLNGHNLRIKIWDKSPLLKNHLPHDGRHTFLYG